MATHLDLIPQYQLTDASQGWLMRNGKRIRWIYDYGSFYYFVCDGDWGTVKAVKFIYIYFCLNGFVRTGQNQHTNRHRTKGSSNQCRSTKKHNTLYANANAESIVREAFVMPAKFSSSENLIYEQNNVAIFENFASLRCDWKRIRVNAIAIGGRTTMDAMLMQTACTSRRWLLYF